ncbi:hypothetical protein LSTR_LSTR005119 [Laodelphax striatellus]|uniref:EF-hand domain-containing protein n=1 Tax=Laodelphax striatellus TaxID=195883 RepID=A0A482WQX9_LAOST|nr:hypothetical protein LSTR_LSTR005119 [Laodelphax striatellus]
MLYIFFLTVLTVFAIVIAMRGPHHPRGHYHSQPVAGRKLTQDTEVLQDVQHIKEDLQNIVPEVDTSKMTPEELEFHYFKLHDFDNNTKLDGLEILHAIHHSTHHDHDSEESQQQQQQRQGKEQKPSDLKNRVAPDKYQSSPDDMTYFTELIDQVLAEDDLDNDGYLSYVEYVVGRKKDQDRRNAQINKR